MKYVCNLILKQYGHGSASCSIQYHPDSASRLMQRETHDSLTKLFFWLSLEGKGMTLELEGMIRIVSHVEIWIIM